MADHNYFSNLIWQISDLLRGSYRPPLCTRDQRGFNGRFPAGPPRVNDDSCRSQKQRYCGQCGG